MNLYEALSDNASFVEAITEDVSSGTDPLDICPSLDSPPDWTPPTFEEVAAVFGCLTCESHYRQWCAAVPGKHFYNLRFLRACPQTAPLRSA